MKDDSRLMRVSVPGRIMDLIWSDDEFFRDISSNKKVSASGKFPKCDQWCDDEGFHMAFALAGYSPSDLGLMTTGNEIQLNGIGDRSDFPEDNNDLQREDGDEYPARTPRPVVHQGVIVRGIARRNFKAKFIINKLFDVSRTKATMKNGLLEIIVPKNDKAEDAIFVKIEE